MLTTPPVLIAVIGPIEPPLLAAWVHHYRWLGIERFLIAFHFPDHVPDVRRHELQAAARELGIVPTGTSTGPWHEHINTHLRDALRHRAGPGWHLLADADEFQQYPAPLTEVIAQADKSGHRVVGGLMLDRVTTSGRLTGWRPEDGLDLAYPLGGHLTHRLLHGDPRKITLARHDVSVSSGSHRSPGHRPDPDRICAVHHFKWRSGILDDLRRRVRHFASGTWQERTPAVRDEASRLLAHVDRHSGVINTSDPRFAFRRVSLDRMPFNWPAEARGIFTVWRPYTHTAQDSATMTTLKHARRERDGHVPLAVLLAGLTGSGKTTVAQALTGHDFIRLSVDEEVHRLHGRYGVDYPEHTYFERQRPVVAAIREQFVKELQAGNDVVLDHGLWRRAERDDWQSTARDAGGHPLVVYLPTDRDELLRRLAERNEREDANALTVTPEALDDFFARFDPPADDEEVITYSGDLDALLSALAAARDRKD